MKKPGTLLNTNLIAPPGHTRAVEICTTRAGAGLLRVVLHEDGKIVHTRPVPGTLLEAFQYAKDYFAKRTQS